MRNTTTAMVKYVLGPLFLFAFTASACPGAKPYNTTLNWTKCSNKQYQVNNIQCATFNVPLDWDACDSQPLLMTAVRVRTNSTNKIGSLFIRDGGPGIELFNLKRFKRLPQYFDIVVLDARGTGLNHPVLCDVEPWNYRFKLFLKTEEEYNATVAAYGRAGESCLEKTGPVINYMDARTHARDMEAMRIALGEPLNIYALSWGSQVASQYANEFPHNIRAMVLDGIVDHSADLVVSGNNEALTAGTTFSRLLGWTRTNKTSPLFGKDTIAEWRALIEKANESPIPIPECIESGLCFPNATGSDIENLYQLPVEAPTNTSGFLDAADCIALALKGNASCFKTNKYTPDDFTRGPLLGAVNPWTQLSIACQEWILDSSWEAYQAWQYMRDVNAVPVGPAFYGYLQLACPQWPTAIRYPPAPIAVDDASAPILVVNALWDPITSYSNALAMHRKIKGSVLLMRDGEGHGSLGFPETGKAIEEYLIDLKLPAPGTVLDKPVGNFA